jgi:flavin reductase (DIM6/NTAB) family NADH-FMN oxidoreductase RutF
LVFSIAKESSSAPTIRAARSVVVHLLGADQLNIARLCATSGIDRFADRSIWQRLASGEPYFPNATSWLRGRVFDRMEVGGSTILAVQAIEAKVPELSVGEAAPLVYHNRTWHRLGEHSTIGT